MEESGIAFVFSFDMMVESMKWLTGLFGEIYRLQLNIALLRKCEIRGGIYFKRKCDSRRDPKPQKAREMN